MKFLEKPLLWLLIILILAAIARSYKIGSPIADWHSWRQADTAAVPRNFYKDGYNPLLPKYDDMSGVAERPIANPNRFRFVEFPIYGSLVYFAYVLNGGVNEVLARVINIIFSLGSIVFLYLITKRYFGEFTALTASLIYALLPFNVFFTRTILPESSLVFFSLGMFYFTNRWIEQNKIQLFLLSVLFTACAFLTKPAAAFYLLPLLYTYFQKEKRLIPPFRYWAFIIIGLLPFVLWRIWISQHPEGIPASNWLFNGNGIRFKPAFWRWIINERLGHEILASTGFILFVIGLLKRAAPKEGSLLHVLALSSFLYLIVMATGNVQHDYYQVIIVPVLAIFTARGFTTLIKGDIPSFVSRIWTIPAALFLFILMFYFGYFAVKDFYNINNPPIIEAGKEADRILPRNAVVVAPYNGDTAFLYQTNRPGWAVQALPLDEMIERYGVTSFISVAKDNDTRNAMNRYTVLKETDNYVIIDLTKPKK